MLPVTEKEQVLQELQKAWVLSAALYPSDLFRVSGTEPVNFTRRFSAEELTMVKLIQRSTVIPVSENFTPV